jgi:hypothetical protein
VGAPPYGPLLGVVPAAIVEGDFIRAIQLFRGMGDKLVKRASIHVCPPFAERLLVMSRHCPFGQTNLVLNEVRVVVDSE